MSGPVPLNQTVMFIVWFPSDPEGPLISSEVIPQMVWKHDRKDRTASPCVASNRLCLSESVARMTFAYQAVFFEVAAEYLADSKLA